MKKRGIFKSLVAVATLGLTLILSLCSCSQQGSQQGEISFTIPHEVFSQIAARATSNLSEADGTDSKVEIYTVPDEDDLTFTISLYDSSNKLINTKSQSKTFAKWLEASANKDISFTFPNIAIGKSVYATASATAVINGTTIEICSGQSDTKIVSGGSNSISLELKFIVVKEKTDYSGSGSLTINDSTNLLNITATPSEKFYLNTGSISLKAVETSTNTDLSENPDLTWNAKLLYGGVDINGYGIEYYKLSKDGNKWSVQLAKKLATAGTYQLYVTATYKGVTSSQITNVEVLNGNYYGFDVTASDFKQKYGSLANGASSEMKALNEDTTIEFYGELNPSTAIEDFIDILAVLPEIYCNLSVDMSGLTGITELPTNVHFINPKPNDPDALEDTYFYSSNLTSIILPGSFTKLKENSFRQNKYNSGCMSLTSITVPATLTQIEDGAFSGCNSLEEIILPENFPAGSVDSNGCLIVKDGTDKKLFFVPGSYKANLTSINFATDFPGVTKICDYAFYRCSTLTGALDLSNITSIGAYAFYNCGDITELTNYDNLKFIGEKAFWAESNGTFDEITFSSDDIVIEEKGLYVNNLNVEFDITEENYDNVRDNIFNGLGYLKYITFNGQTILPDLLESDLINGSPISDNSNPHPKALLQEVYYYLETITFNNTNNFKIGDYQFAKFSQLKTITTNGGKINEVGNYAFYSKDTGYSVNKISNIDLSACTKIGDFAFYECTNFKSEKTSDTDVPLDLSNVQYIGEQAFLSKTWQANGSYTYHCKASKINLKNAKSIGYRAFFGWTGLTTIEELGTNVEEGCVIGDEAFAFYNITGSGVTNNDLKMSLHTINSTTPYTADLSHVRIIGASAFRNCSFDTKTEGSKTTVIISSDIIAIGSCAFYPNSLVTSYPTNMTFASMPDGKTGTWYEVKHSSSNSTARNNLWKQIVAGTKNAFTTDDISSYQTTLGTDNVVQVSDTTTIKSSIISQSDTTGSYYIRVITSN